MRIRPAPGKQAVVSTPQKSFQQSNLTPAEKAVKEDIEFRLNQANREYDANIIYRDIHYKEVENDGYEAVVLVDLEIRNANKEWVRRYRLAEANLSGNSWISDSGSLAQDEEEIENAYPTADYLRAWRDIKINGIKEVALINEPREKGCAKLPITQKTDIQLEIENKGDKQRILELVGRKIGRATDGISVPVDTNGSPCGTPEVDISSGQSHLIIEPKTTKTYSINGKLDLDYMRLHCCVYRDSSLSEFKFSTQYDTIDGFKSPGNLWFEHLQYIP